jgi:hypothetical protein
MNPFGGEFYTGSKVGVHTCLEESFIQVQRQEFILVWRRVLHRF